MHLCMHQEDMHLCMHQDCVDFVSRAQEIMYSCMRVFMHDEQEYTYK